MANTLNSCVFAICLYCGAIGILILLQFRYLDKAYKNILQLIDNW